MSVAVFPPAVLDVSILAATFSYLCINAELAPALVVLAPIRTPTRLPLPAVGFEPRTTPRIPLEATVLLPANDDAAPWLCVEPAPICGCL